MHECYAMQILETKNKNKTKTKKQKKQWSQSNAMKYKDHVRKTHLD